MSSVENTGKRIKEQFRKFTGTEALEEFSLVGLFSDVFRHHEMAEMERMFAVGTPGNVPALEDVNTSWPRPWMFVRTLIGSGVVYGLFLLCWDVFENLNLLPGLILTGAMAIPLSTVLFFFEVNVRRNVSLYQVVRLLFLGGIGRIRLDNLHGLATAGKRAAAINGFHDDVAANLATIERGPLHGNRLSLRLI